MTNKDKTRLYITKQKYVYVKQTTKQAIVASFYVGLAGAFILLCYLYLLAIRANKSTELISPIGEIRAYSEPTPTPEQLCYLPSIKTRTLIDRNPGFAGKLKSKYGECEWLYAAELIARESSFNPGAINPTSGSCGLGQFLPCSKLKCELTDIDCQLNAIAEYVSNRYGSFKEAISFHNLHNWY